MTPGIWVTPSSDDKGLASVARRVELIAIKKLSQWPTSLWSTDTAASLEACATIYANDVESGKLSEIATGLSGFMAAMCKTPHVEGIGFNYAEARADLLVDPVNVNILRTVVASCCRWQEENLEVPYFEVQTVSKHIFTARTNSYSIIAYPQA